MVLSIYYGMLVAGNWSYSRSAQSAHLSNYPGPGLQNSSFRNTHIFNAQFWPPFSNNAIFYPFTLFGPQYVMTAKFEFIGCWSLATPFSALMFLHRGFFVQALTDNPMNPLKSVHSQSFIAAYKSACQVLDCTRDHYAQQPRLVPRVWRIWSNAFSAAVRNIHTEPITIRFQSCSFPGHHRGSGNSQPECNPRAVSPGETEPCVWPIPKRIRKQQSGVEGTG